MVTWMGAMVRMGCAWNDSNNQLEIYKDHESMRSQDQESNYVITHCQWSQYNCHHCCNEHHSHLVLWMETSVGRINALGARSSNPFCHHFGIYNRFFSLGSIFLPQNYNRWLL
jgi:hypothetical protein